MPARPAPARRRRVLVAVVAPESDSGVLPVVSLNGFLPSNCRDFLCAASGLPGTARLITMEEEQNLDSMPAVNRFLAHFGHTHHKIVQYTLRVKRDSAKNRSYSVGMKIDSELHYPGEDQTRTGCATAVLHTA
jgi:hypothetical protein